MLWIILIIIVLVFFVVKASQASDADSNLYALGAFLVCIAILGCGVVVSTKFDSTEVLMSYTEMVGTNNTQQLPNGSIAYRNSKNEWTVLKNPTIVIEKVNGITYVIYEEKLCKSNWFTKFSIMNGIQQEISITIK